MTEQTKRPVFLAAGGTGGHIFPAEALAEALLKRGEEVALVTDTRFKDYHTIAGDSVFANIPLHMIQTGRMGGGVLKKLKGVMQIGVGRAQARKLMKQHKPKAVIGFGGYPSFPTMLAASSLKIPTLLHEQNALLGRTNRWLLKRVSCVATSYPDTQLIPAAQASKAVFTGNPVRRSIQALNSIAYLPPQEDGALRLLVVGGSQGANIFSDVVPKAIAALPEAARLRLRVEQQCRPEDMERTRAAYKEMGLQADLAPFFGDMAARLASAHLVISRAGASSVAELTCSGRPAILVPLPTAMDNHQYVNAQAIEDNEAGWVMSQDGFTPEALSNRLESYLNFSGPLQKAAENMRELGNVSAADDLAQLVLDVAEGKPMATQNEPNQAQPETQTSPQALKESAA